MEMSTDIKSDFDHEEFARRMTGALKAATPSDHVVSSYILKVTRHGFGTPESRNQLFKDAAVSTAQWLRRPLTSEEIERASHLVGVFNRANLT